MRPPNPKYCTGKPLQVVGGFRCCGIGYSITEKGNIRLDGKRDSRQLVDYITPEQLAQILWEHLERNAG